MRILFVWASLAFAGPVFGCICVTFSPKTTFQRSKHVFVGELVAVESQWPHPPTMTFRVVERFKGAAEGEQVTVVLSGGCGYRGSGAPGSRQLIYAVEDGLVGLAVSDCGRSREVSRYANCELSLLRARAWWWRGTLSSIRVLDWFMPPEYQRRGRFGFGCRPFAIARDPKWPEETQPTFAELQQRLEARQTNYRPCATAGVERVGYAIAAIVSDPSTPAEARQQLEEVLERLEEFSVARHGPSASTARSFAAVATAMRRIAWMRDRTIAVEQRRQWIATLLQGLERSAQAGIDAAADEPDADVGRLAAARAKLDEGRTAVAAGSFGRAASRFADAVTEAEKASKWGANPC